MIHVKREVFMFRSDEREIFFYVDILRLCLLITLPFFYRRHVFALELSIGLGSLTKNMGQGVSFISYVRSSSSFFFVTFLIFDFPKVFLNQSFAAISLLPPPDVDEPSHMPRTAEAYRSSSLE